MAVVNVYVRNYDLLAWGVCHCFRGTPWEIL
jgi:hypothetical protein